jgi:4-amino-4-deoxy-L-arabinose transferase-like glycosyltransferase
MSLRLRPGIIVTLLILIGTLRIATTWRVLADTTDETTHIGAGLDLLQHHEYVVQPENPPFPRIVMALAPQLGGMRWPAEGNHYQQIHEELYGRGNYEHNLVLMRAGNLFFFILACAALFIWVRREFGEREAVLAVLLFTMQPIILGYSGVATLDAAAVAGLAVAMITFSSWIRRPDPARAALLGAGYGFSILCKFSNIGYVPAACAAMFAVRLLSDPERRRERLRAMATLLLVPLVTFAVIWAGYGFTVGRLSDLEHYQHELGLLDRLLLSHLPPSTPLPAPLFFRGIGGLLELDRGGFQSYLFGRVGTNGWWWYFPAAVGLKTTLAFFALILAGAGAAWANRAKRWAMAETLAGAAAILAVALPSTLDLGVRYVLPLYVPLTAAAAIGTAALLDSVRKEIRYAAVLLVVLHIASSLAAHPDYFPYFNELAGGDPGRYLVDSNLDWGQDILRLRRAVRQRGIQHIRLNVGWADFDRLGFPRSGAVTSMQPQLGWIAVSEQVYRTEHADRGWSWLDPYPMTRIGKSIRLYNVPRLPAPVTAVSTADEKILLPIAGTAGLVGAPVGIWFRVDQTVRNIGTSRMRVELSACETKPAPCHLDLEPGRSERLATGPGKPTFILATIPRGTAKQLAFTTVVHAGNWPAVQVPAVSESAFQPDRILIPAVPTNARLNLRVWLLAAGAGTPIDVRIYSPRDGKLIAERTYTVDHGYFSNGDLGPEFPGLHGEPVNVEVESGGAKVWAMMTTTDYRTGKIVISVPR